jgi:hypothetical protein
VKILSTALGLNESSQLAAQKPEKKIEKKGINNSEDCHNNER